MNRGIALLFFALLLLTLAAWAQRDAPPRPVYDSGEQHPKFPLIEFEAEQELRFAFQAPAARLRGIWLQHLFTDPEALVLIQVENLTRDELLLREHIGPGHQHWARLPATNAAGDELAVTYRLARSRKDRFPALIQAVKRSASAPAYPLQLTLSDREFEDGPPWPLFQLRYAHPLRPFLFLWPFLLLGGAVLYLREAGRKWILAYLLLLALAASATSYFAWIHTWEADWSRVDPSGHLAHAESLSDRLRGEAPSTRSGSSEPPRWQARSHLPLTPLLAAGLTRFGLPLPAAAFFVAGLSSCALLLLVDRYLQRRLQVGSRTTVLVLTLLASNLAWTQAFLRPSPHTTAAFLALAACLLVALRSRHPFPWYGELLFGGILLALALVHPPGFAASLFFVLLAILADTFRRRGLRLTEQARSLEVYLMPAAVIYALLVLGFDWPASMRALREQAVQNQHLSPWTQALPPLLVTLQALVFLRPGPPLEKAPRVDGVILSSWCLFFLLSAASSLEPFQLRTWVPILPAVVLLASAGVERHVQARPRFALAAVLLLATANLWAVAALLRREGPFDSWAGGFLTW